MNKQSGYSLLELIIVIVIIGILTATVVPSYLALVNRAKVVAARESVTTLYALTEVYALSHGGAYPVNLTALTLDGDKATLKVLPLDPWGKAYVYNATTHVVTSLVRDKAVGVSGFDTDISSDTPYTGV